MFLRFDMVEMLQGFSISNMHAKREKREREKERDGEMRLDNRQFTCLVHFSPRAFVHSLFSLLNHKFDTHKKDLHFIPNSKASNSGKCTHLALALIDSDLQHIA